MLATVAKARFVGGAQRKTTGMVWATSVLVVYTIFGFLILPWIVKAVARTQISKLLDRETNIRQVRFNPNVLTYLAL